MVSISHLALVPWVGIVPVEKMDRNIEYRFDRVCLDSQTGSEIGH